MTAQVADVVLDIVRELLDGRPVALDDDLFDLGFDSLLIARAAARVRERLDVDPPLSVYFDAATPADLVAAITAGAR